MALAREEPTKEMQVIRRLFTKAASRGKIQANPAAGMKAGTVMFRATKNEDDRLQYLNATARALLESLPAPIDPTVNVFQAPPTKSRRVEGKLTREQEQGSSIAGHDAGLRGDSAGGRAAGFGGPETDGSEDCSKTGAWKV